MIITQMEIMPVAMGKEDPEWRFARSIGGEAKTRAFIVKLRSDEGLTGFGYTGASAHFGNSLKGVKAALEIYGKCLIGEDPFNAERIFVNMERNLQGNNGATAAIDLAVHDLQAKALDMPLYTLLGGLIRDEIPIIRILALKDPAQMSEIAAKHVEQGYSYLKIKLSGEPIKDIDRVKAIRNAVGHAIHLTVDANQTYSPKAAIDTLKRMQEYNIELCEQPVRADDLEGLASVTRSVDCIIEAHEGAQSLEKIFTIVKNKAADSIIIKIGQLGGLRRAKIAAAICKIGNISCRIGTTGSQIMAAASMHFVASTDNISYACELGEFSRLLDDPVSGLEIKNGQLKVPTGPGIGVSIRD